MFEYFYNEILTHTQTKPNPLSQTRRMLNGSNRTSQSQSLANTTLDPKHRNSKNIQHQVAIHPKKLPVARAYEGSDSEEDLTTIGKPSYAKASKSSVQNRGNIRNVNVRNSEVTQNQHQQQSQIGRKSNSKVTVKTPMSSKAKQQASLHSSNCNKRVTPPRVETESEMDIIEGYNTVSEMMRIEGINRDDEVEEEYENDEDANEEINEPTIIECNKRNSKK